MLSYEQIKRLKPEYVKKKVIEFLKEDIPDEDITSKHTINKNNKATAHIIAGDKFVFAGEQIIQHCFPKDCTIQLNIIDGAAILKGDLIGTIKGPTRTLLKRERVMLNLIQRLSGIATMTSHFVNKAKPFKVKILDTRKTTPGLRLFEKYAVKIGGGWNHRLNLSTGILIKDNHIQAAGGVSRAIQKIKKQPKKLIIELEVDNLAQTKEGLKNNVGGFLLDNMNPKTIKEAVNIIRNHKNGKNIFIEASGGITLTNLSEYINTGIDAISTGAITHSPKNADIKIDIK